MTGLEKLLSHKTHVVWDWNGTLLDDRQLCMDIMADLLKTHGLPEMTPERYGQIFRMPVIDYYRDLGFDFTRTSFEELARQFIEQYSARVLECSLFKGAKDLLSSLKKNGKRLAILSAAREIELKELTRHYAIEVFFDAIYGLTDHYAVSKIDRGRELMSHWNVEPSSIILVGDMDHDAHVGEALGIDVLLLADGHQGYDRLQHFPQVLKFRHS